jgi:hypothetical protein
MSSVKRETTIYTHSTDAALPLKAETHGGSTWLTLTLSDCESVTVFLGSSDLRVLASEFVNVANESEATRVGAPVEVLS